MEDTQLAVDVNPGSKVIKLAYALNCLISRN